MEKGEERVSPTFLMSLDVQQYTQSSESKVILLNETYYWYTHLLLLYEYQVLLEQVFQQLTLVLASPLDGSGDETNISTYMCLLFLIRKAYLP